MSVAAYFWTSSISFVAICAMWSRRTRTRTGMNAGTASLRNRVCAGGSMKSICLTMTLATGLTSAAPRLSKNSGEGARWAKNYVRTVMTSS